MQLHIARSVLPIADRRDWKGSRLTYLPRAAYGDTETWHSRLMRKLRNARR